MRRQPYNETMFKRILRSKTLEARARWILGLLAAVLILPMVIFFNWSGVKAGTGPGGAAGVIFGRRIPWETFQREYDIVHRSFQATIGEDTLSKTFAPFLRQQTWDRLILAEEAKRRVTVPDDEVARYLRTQPAFQQNGRFVPDLYYRYVRAAGFTPQAFEEQIRNDLRIQKLIDRVNAETTVTDEQMKTAYAEKYQRLQAALVVIKPSSLESQIRSRITEERLRAYYASHQDLAAIPVQRTIDYLGMSLSEAASLVPQPTDEGLQAYYTESRDDFKQVDGTVPELPSIRDRVRRAFQESRAKKSLTTLALDLEDSVEERLRFEEIAVARHLPIRRIGPGGRLTLEAPNGPTHEMLSKAFDVELGHMTETQQAPAGVFLLRPVEEIPGRIQPFEQVRDQIERMAVLEQEREAAEDHARHVRDETLALRRAGLTFEEACAVLGVRPERPAPFIPAQDPELAAASQSALEQLARVKRGDLSEVISTPARVVFAFVEDQLPFDAAQFDRDKVSFRATLLKTKQQEHFAQWMDALRAQARLKTFVDQPQPSGIP